MKQSLPLLSLALLSIQFLACCGETVDMTGRTRGKTEYLGAVPSRAGHPELDTISHWDGDGVEGTPSIRIDLSDQKAYFFKGTDLVGVAMISTGREGFDTPTGSFSVIQKNADHRSNLYGEWIDSAGNVIDNDVDVRKKPNPPPGVRFVGAPMPHFMRINGGVGMHAGYLPGFPASHGCIRLPAFMAEHFFREAPKGTRVDVTH